MDRINDPRHTHKYRVLRRQWLATMRPGEVCSLCGLVVDLKASGRTPTGPTVEHTIPVRDAPELALDVSLWRLAHARCQSKQGVAYVNEKRWGPRRIFPTTRRW